MESVIKVTPDVFKRLEGISASCGVDVDTLASQYLIDILDVDEDTLLFEQSVREALAEVESRPFRNLTEEEFLKELESW